MPDALQQPRNVNPLAAERLLAAGDVRVLDVRSPAEYRDYGHIPGALLLPVDLIAAGPATLPQDGPPLLVVCEHGMRSAHAAAVLCQAGFTDVVNMTGGMSCWAGPREQGPPAPENFAGPSPWLLSCGDLLPSAGEALDVACGRGRHALLLAATGLRVRAVDRDPHRIVDLGLIARRLGLPVEAEQRDLEEKDAAIGEASYDVILGVNYLHRPLFPALCRALRPGGILIWETFTTGAAAGKGPSNPDFLLRPDELHELVSPLTVVRHREGEFEGRHVASVAARAAAGDDS
ncbi:MAG: rhodanese-like domain-containing protein [Acidobacteriota bacterium]